MNEEEIKRIKNAVTDSGFLLEVKAHKALVEGGWKVSAQSKYYEKKQERIKEIDLIAEKIHQSTSEGVLSKNTILVIECKKESSTPWIFLEQPGIEVHPFTLNAITPEGVDISYGRLNEKSSHYFKKGPIYTCRLTPFKPQQEDNSQIEKAINQVTSALSFLADQNEKYLAIIPDQYGILMYPIIIFEGQLLGVKVSDNYDLQIEEKDHIRCLISFETDEPHSFRWDQTFVFAKNKPILIDIVRIEYLKEFLKNF